MYVMQIVMQHICFYYITVLYCMYDSTDYLTMDKKLLLYYAHNYITLSYKFLKNSTIRSKDLLKSSIKFLFYDLFIMISIRKNIISNKRKIKYATLTKMYNYTKCF